MDDDSYHLRGYSSMETKTLLPSISVLQKLLILLTLSWLSFSCEVITPDSHSMTMTAMDLMIGAPPKADAVLPGVVVQPVVPSGEIVPDDMTLETVTDADGMITLRLGPFQHAIHFQKTDYMTAVAWFRMGNNNVDISPFPVLMPYRDNEGNYCLDLVGLENSADAHSSAWLRVYKTAGVFISSDILTINTIVNGFNVAGGIDLANVQTAQENYNFIDIYADSNLSSSDSDGHKDVDILANNNLNSTESLYNVRLNNSSVQINILPCSREFVNIVFL